MEMSETRGPDRARGIGGVLMRRRQFITILGGAAVTWPLTARAQRPSDRLLIGFLDGKRQSSGQGLINAFQQGLRELGYDEGRNIDVVHRFADGLDERLPALAEELVRLKPAVIVAPGVNAAVTAKNVTTTIPIVSWALADAVHLGLVASYAHPGGNVTGITPYVDGLPAKQMELARDVVPGAGKVGLLGNMNDPKAPPQRHELEDAAQSLKVKVIVPELRNPEDLDGAMQLLAGERVDVVIVLQTAMTLSERQQIAALALANRLPTVFGYRENVDDGGLISYGVDLRWCSRRAAAYVHKILHGTAPSDLPVEFPTRLQLVVNLKTAKALGLTIPPTLLVQADEVIQEAGEGAR
jgi:putative tryptophan/tyrosine transport system substrate-binding protein